MFYFYFYELFMTITNPLIWCLFDGGVALCYSLFCLRRKLSTKYVIPESGILKSLRFVKKYELVGGF